MIAFYINEINICGGTHKQFLKLIEYTDRQGVDFFIITHILDLNKTYSGFKKYEDKISVVKLLPISNRLQKLNIIRNIRILRKAVRHADTVNLHEGGYMYLPAFKGKKVIWQINDMPRLFRVGVAANDKVSFFAKIWKRYIIHNLKYVDLITVNVTKNAERVKQCFKREAKILYCGVDSFSFYNDIKKTKERFANNKINLLTSGVFFPYRNYETQILAVEILKKIGLNIQLNIIGAHLDCTYTKKIKDLIHEKSLDEEIHVLGQVSNEQFEKLHSDSDIFVFVNVDQSWGLAVFEAMSCGIPVIVSKSVGATEILSDGYNSVFVDPKSSEEIANSIIRLYTNFDEYEKIANNGKTLIQLYSWDNSYSSKMLNLLTEE